MPSRTVAAGRAYGGSSSGRMRAQTCSYGQAQVTTYTESGWLTSYEWFVNELHEGDELYAEVWEATIDELAEEGDLDEDNIDAVNAFAQKLGIDAEWEIEE